VLAFGNNNSEVGFEVSLSVAVVPAFLEFAVGEVAACFDHRGIFEVDVSGVVGYGYDVVAVFEFAIFFTVAPGLDGADDGLAFVEGAAEGVEGHVVDDDGVEADVAGGLG